MAKKKPYRFFVYLAARFNAALLGFLPRRVLMTLARLLGRLTFATVARQRESALASLRKVYAAEKSEAEIRATAEKVFENLSQTAAELLKFKTFSAANIDKLVDAGSAADVYGQLLAEGRGLISITPHFGNWELLAGYFGLKGFKGAVMARKIYYEPYNRWIVGIRAKLNVRTIYRTGATREILELLGRGEILGLLPDQDINSVRGAFVPFFGRLAYTPVAPVRLALSSGAPLVTNFMVRQGLHYKLVIGRVIRPKIETTREAAEEKFTAEWMAEFEKIIRQYPEQYAWMHNRWRTQPGQERFKSRTGKVAAK